MSEEKDNVGIKHAEYEATEGDRQTFAYAIGGTKALRANAKTLLPRLPMEDTKSHDFRCAWSTTVNVTEKTRDTLVGLVFQKPVMLGEDVPKEIADLCENIDNRGNHLNVAARELFSESFDGWAVWLVDMPSTGTVADKDIQNKLGLRPYIALYRAAFTTNWDWSVNAVSGKIELSMCILKECHSKRTGKFKRTDEVYYLACFLEGNVASWIRYKEITNDKKEIEYVEVGSGVFEKQTEIPISIVGKLGNTPPLLDLAHKNIEFSQTWSDVITFARKTRCVLPFATGISEEEAKKAADSESLWILPLEGEVGFAQADGSTLQDNRDLLKDAKEEMAWLGLQMLMPTPKNGSAATATEVVSDTLQDTSALQVRAEQLKDAIERAFGFMAKYLGVKGDKNKIGGSIELGCSWQQMVLSPQDLQVWNTMATDGNISLETFLYKLEKAGMLPPDVTAEQEAAKVEKEQKELGAVKNANKMPNEKTTTIEPPKDGEEAK